MRHKGKVTNWKDDQGFGFVTPNGGGQKAYVHIKSFFNSHHRPTDGDVISYELATDAQGRFFAKDIRYAKGTLSSTNSKKTNAFGTIFFVLFTLLFICSALLGQLPTVIIGLYIIASTVLENWLFYATLLIYLATRLQSSTGYIQHKSPRAMPRPSG